ncbi:MAG: carbohydrate deacetylase [Planctomycetota bacterium]|jgi:predicted glycoside hydrolase/deacetylase ChbG (UPF0249 family)
MRKLIVNADDFGFSKAVTDGIIDCHQHGCVTSTTLMANMPATEYAAEQAAGLPGLSVGVHLVLNGGRPISHPASIPDLVNADGSFFGAGEAVRRAKCLQLPTEQAEEEFSAQVEKCLSLGINPTHCDSHHNITVNPQPCIAMMRVAKRFNIPSLRTYRGWYRMERGRWRLFKLTRMLKVNIIRAPKQIYYELLHWYWRLRGFRLPGAKYGFYKVIADKPLQLNLDGWTTLLKSLPDCVCELVVHPGLPDKNASADSDFGKQRVLEHRLFSVPKTRHLCQELGIKLVNFREL